MAEQRVTQRELVEAGFHSNTISSYRNDKNKTMSYETALGLMEYFDCPFYGKDGLFIIEEL